MAYNYTFETDNGSFKVKTLNTIMKKRSTVIILALLGRGFGVRSFVSWNSCLKNCSGVFMR